jgi:hypothetical protein
MLLPTNRCPIAITDSHRTALGGQGPVSVQALAGNARELLEELCREAGMEPMMELLLQDHSGKLKKDIHAALSPIESAPSTWAKPKRRGKRISAPSIGSIIPKMTTGCTLVSMTMFGSRGAMLIPMQAFHSWFCAHVNLLIDQSHAQEFLDFLPDFIQQMTRPQQKRIVAAHIECFCEDLKVVTHPNTEPLVIDH